MRACQFFINGVWKSLGMPTYLTKHNAVKSKFQKRISHENLDVPYVCPDHTKRMQGKQAV